MTLEKTAARLAGKALGQFLDAVSGSTQKAAFNYLKGQADYTDAPGLLGMIASHPETTSKVAGAAAPIAAVGTAMAGANLVDRLMQQPSLGAYSSSYSLPLQPGAAIPTGKPHSFSSQQYVPGMSPMTNMQVGNAILDQQRFEHQLQLIQARQMASTSGGSLLHREAAGNPVDRAMGMLQSIYS